MTIMMIAVFSVAAVLMALQLKSVKPEYAAYLIFGAGLFLFGAGLSQLSRMISMLEKIESYLPISQVYISALLKMLGITYLAEFSSGICRDAGYSSFASQIEIFARLLILAVGMPIILSLLETVDSLLS